MIVCHCKAITDRQIRDAARRGARTGHEVAAQCRAGGQCGGCVPLIEELLKVSERAAQRPTTNRPS